MDITTRETPGASTATPDESQPKRVLSKWLPKRIRARHVTLANILYEHLQDVSWKTELTLATELGVTTRQIRRAKAYLEYMGRVVVEVGQNGRRGNPIHTLVKTSPIKPIIVSGGGRSRVNWHALEDLSAGDLNEMTLEDLFDLYEEAGLPFFPLHYPKFKPDSTPYCSCKRGKNCPYIGKHPVIRFKELDFTARRTYREMRDHWFEDDINYNVGFRADAFMVVDVDYRSGGAESLGLLEEELGELPDTLTVRTGNGRHLYLGDANSADSSATGLWKGIDVKTGEGSFVVAPPSVHKSGERYVWESVGEPEVLPEAWGYAMFDGKTARAKTNAGRGRAYSGVRRKIQLPRLLTPDYVIEKGYRNDTLFLFAARERGQGAGYRRVLEVITEINRTHCREPLTTSELENIVASACRYQTNAEKSMRRAA